MVNIKAIKILEKCEADLRALVGAAASSGDYDAVLGITSWAKQSAALSSTSAVTEKPPGSAAQKKAGSRASYPRFAKRGDQLVKIGWSKREKREYEHKAPRQAALLLARIAADIGKDGRVFQVNALIPLRDPTDG